MKKLLLKKKPFLKNGAKLLNKKFIKGGVFLPFILLSIFFLASVILPLLGIFLSPSAEDFSSVFSSPSFKTAARHTIIQCLCSTSLAVFIGYIFAYTVSKTDIYGKKLFSFVPLLHLVTPPFVGGLSFILLFGRQGFITHRILGLDISLYGFSGLLIAQSLCFFPVAYLICLQSLKNIPESLENAAVTLGSSKAKIFWTVIFPLSFQGLLSSFLFIAVSVLSDFGNPLLVAGRYRVLAVEVYTKLTGWLNKGEGAVLGLVLIVPSIILFLIQNKITNAMNLRLATVDGSSITLKSQKKRKKMPSVSEIFLFSVCTLISLLVLAQFLAIIFGSFQTLWGIKTDFTLKHIKSTLTHSQALLNSIFFALISALLSTIIALFSTFIVHRTDTPLKRTFDTISQIPSAVPGTLYGISLSLTAAFFHLPLSSFSPVLIIIAMTTSFLPFSYRILTSTLAQVHTTLDDSALSLGDTPVKLLFKVLSPVIKGGLFGSFIYDFIRGIGTLSSVIFLVSFNTPLASVTILNLAEQGDWGSACAMALILTILTFLILSLAKLPAVFRVKSDIR